MKNLSAMRLCFLLAALLGGGVAAMWWGYPRSASPVPGHSEFDEGGGRAALPGVAGERPYVDLQLQRTNSQPAETPPSERRPEAASEDGEAAVERAIAAAKADPARKAATVRALGGTRAASAQAYVAEALNAEDPAVVCAAIAAWAERKGEAGIGEIVAVLKSNRERKDGPRTEVAVACVQALGGLMSSSALPALEQELDMALRSRELPSYGLDLIEAVADIGDSRGAVMLERYADELQGELSGAPTVRRAQMWQIVQARIKAEELR